MQHLFAIIQHRIRPIHHRLTDMCRYTDRQVRFSWTTMESAQFKQLLITMGGFRSAHKAYWTGFDANRNWYRHHGIISPVWHAGCWCWQMAIVQAPLRNILHATSHPEGSEFHVAFPACVDYAASEIMCRCLCSSRWLLHLSSADWTNCLPASLIQRLQSVQNAAARLIYSIRRSEHIT